MGIEPTPSAWKAEVLPLNYTRLATPNSGFQHSGLTRSKPTAFHSADLVEGEGFEPSKAAPTDLQSAPFDRSGTPPKSSRIFWWRKLRLSIAFFWKDQKN